MLSVATIVAIAYHAMCMGTMATTHLLLHLVGVLVDRDSDDLEAVVSQLVLQHLPPGQVEGAPSPRGEGDEQPLLGTVVRQRVPRPIEVGKREVRRTQVLQRGAPGASSAGRRHSGTRSVHVAASAPRARVQRPRRMSGHRLRTFS